MSKNNYSERNTTCKNCRAWDNSKAYYSANTNLGYCRLVPGKVFTNEKQTDAVTFWPETAENEFCLLFEEKITEEDVLRHNMEREGKDY
jgi:hypothetical protein